jgi:hypothetical protein
MCIITLVCLSVSPVKQEAALLQQQIIHVMEGGNLLSKT